MLLLKQAMELALFVQSKNHAVWDKFQLHYLLRFLVVIPHWFAIAAFTDRSVNWKTKEIIHLRELQLINVPTMATYFFFGTVFQKKLNGCISTDRFVNIAALPFVLLFLVGLLRSLRATLVLPTPHQFERTITWSHPVPISIFITIDSWKTCAE